MATIAEGLLIDEAGAYRDGFLQKQAEVLGQLAQRHQQERHLMFNRVRKLGGSKGSDEPGLRSQESGVRT